MTRPSSPLVAAFVIILACFAWIGGISYGLVYLFGLSSITGWVIAGALGLVAVLVVGVFLFELRNAVDLTDCDNSPEFENRPLPAHRKAAPTVQVAHCLSPQA
jgi:uncharacterized membrane protein